MQVVISYSDALWSFHVYPGDWRDITCITYDEVPDPFQGQKGIYIKHTGVEIASNTECGLNPSAGQCGYFPEGRAMMSIPYFSWSDFAKFSLNFWFRRQPNTAPTYQTLINKYPDGMCANSAFEVASRDMQTVRGETLDGSGTMLIQLANVSYLTYQLVLCLDWNVQLIA